MDMISQLPDDLIYRILLRVQPKDVFTLSCVSKRWQSIWNLVSRVEFDDRNHHDYKSFREFVNKTFVLINKVPVLVKLNLNLGPNCDAVDVGIWIDTAVAHGLCELRVLFWSGAVSLPSSLFTCKTLDTLTLINCSDVVPYCCLPSLEILDLKDVRNASLGKLLSGCPKLDYLGVWVAEEHEGIEDMIVASPCLRRLRMEDIRSESKGGVYVIEAPCLKILKIIDDVVYDSRRIENMPNLFKAYIDITQGVTHKFLRALASARSLNLYVSLLSQVPSLNIFFYRLVHLELNTCAQGWWELLTYMLQNSPKLTSLKLTDEHQLRYLLSKETSDCWKRPTSISESV